MAAAVSSLAPICGSCTGCCRKNGANEQTQGNLQGKFLPNPPGLSIGLSPEKDAQQIIMENEKWVF